MKRALLIGLLCISLSGCQAMGNLGNSISNSMPVLGERCESVQCITPAGKARSDAIRDANRRAAEQAAKQQQYPQGQYPQGTYPQQQTAPAQPVNTYPPGYPGARSAPADNEDSDSTWW